MILTEERRDVYLPLDECDVPESALDRLACMGVNTLDELRDLWAYGNRQLLVEYLGDTPVRFALYRPPPGATRGAAASGPGQVVNLLAAGRTPPLAKRPRGAALTGAQRKRKAGPIKPVPAGRRRGGKAVSLVDRFPRARDQGQRPTCVAFASVALLEYHLYGASPKTKHHSEQFVYWASKDRDGIPNVDGTYVRTGRNVLKSQGACLDKTWRYSKLPAATQGQGPPPAGAEEEAAQYKWADSHSLSPKDPTGIRERLDDGRPVVLSVHTFDSWDYPLTQNTGEIPMPFPGTPSDGGHAVCVVGYELQSAAPGGGVFIFRNSWGKTFGRTGRFGKGYGTLFFDYVRQYGLEACY